jgi:hypothetical protein
MDPVKVLQENRRFEEHPFGDPPISRAETRSGSPFPNRSVVEGENVTSLGQSFEAYLGV